MKIDEIIRIIEDFAPLSYQESYDNAGLLVGDRTREATGVVLCVDVTRAVLDEAVACGANLVVSHHPVIFHPLKRLTGATHPERMVQTAIERGIALYAAHTNLDSCAGGINFCMAEMLGLQSVEVLAPRGSNFLKVVVFAPEAHAEKVRQAMFDAGAGAIGGYDRCSYNAHGEGTFRPGEGTDPFVGERGTMHTEAETRIEVIAPRHRSGAVVRALLAAHPYEAPAYDLIPLENRDLHSGFGTVGMLPEAVPAEKYLARLKTTFGTGAVRHTAAEGRTVRRVAISSGSGGSMIGDALRSGADVFITADLRYDAFLEADPRMILADVGHFESEYCAIDILYDVITKKFPTFAVRKSVNSANPVNYLA